MSYRALSGLDRCRLVTQGFTLGWHITGLWPSEAVDLNALISGSRGFRCLEAV